MKKIQAIFVALIMAITLVAAPCTNTVDAASKCIKTFSVYRVCNCQTKVSGKGLKYATVRAYARGKLIGKSTVNSKGCYSIRIPKQKSGTCITVKISKKYYTTRKKCVTVRRYTSSTHHHSSSHHSGHHC